MAYCRNCGADIGDAKYCPNCGTPQATPQEEHVSRPQNYILRFKRFSGGAPVVKTKITIDGIVVGSIPEGGMLEVPIQRGTHALEMQAWSNPKLSQTLFVDGEEEEIYLPFKLSAMGKPQFTSEANQAVVNPMRGYAQKEHSPNTAATIQSGTYYSPQPQTVNRSPKSGSYNSQQPRTYNVTVKQPKKIGCLGTILILFAVLVVIGFIGSLGGNTVDKQANKPSSTPAESSIDASTDNPEEAVDVTEEQTAFKIGETLSFGDLDVTVNSYTFSDHLANVSYGNPTENGNRWCVVNVTMKNTGKETIKLRSDFLGPSLNYTYRLYYDTDYSYLSSWIEDSCCIQTREELKPLETATATVNFEVPKEVETNKDKPLVITFSSNKTDATEYEWVLR